MPKKIETETSRSPPLEANFIIDGRIVMSSKTSPDNDLKSTLAYKILTRNKFPLFHIRRPWRRVQRMASPLRILVLTRKNHKVHADIGSTVSVMRRATAVLDTEARPNLIRKNELSLGMESQIAHRPSWDIGDAKKRPQQTIGSLKMPVRLGKCITLVKCIEF